jgi:ectoine hydroxylase-related dioxygenase (phytanoyl-CoA dioxygenase family)
MLTEYDKARFRTCGFVVLKNCLSEGDLVAIEKGYERVMKTASAYDYFGDNGTLMADGVEDKDPIFANLVSHEILMEAMRDLWGTPALYLGSDVWSNRDEVPWHCDETPGSEMSTVKATIYLDDMTADQGALNLVVGSNNPDWNRNLFQNCGFFDQGRPRIREAHRDLPGSLSLATNRGDVVIWQTGMWHSAWKRQDGRPRRAIFYIYFPDPGDDVLAAERLRRKIQQMLSADRQCLYGPNFLRDSEPEVQRMIDRLESLGIENVRPAPASQTSG